jgi:multidrug efflux pump subunit AcrA (membrane-fusion protein)
MNRTGLILLALLFVAVPAAVVGWRNAAQLRVEVQALQAQLQTAQQEAASSSDAKAKQREAELERLRAENQDVLKLRGEVTQLRSGAKEVEKLRAENLQLKSVNQQLAATKPAATATTVTPAESAKDHFPREAWAFSGYATPEAALISAISAMKEGNPKTYLDSLAPDEQARMAKIWENKSEAELSTKHQQDVSAITGMRVVDRKTISPDEVQMSVYIQGVDRLEKVSMKLVNNEWKFGGFIRDPKK